MGQPREWPSYSNSGNGKRKNRSSKSTSNQSPTGPTDRSLPIPATAPITTLPHGGFVYTSNVDGHFIAAGFDPARIVECHDNIHRMQCIEPCTGSVWQDRHSIDGDPDPSMFAAIVN